MTKLIGIHKRPVALVRDLHSNANGTPNSNGTCHWHSMRSDHQCPENQPLKRKHTIAAAIAGYVDKESIVALDNRLSGSKIV